MPPDPDDLLAGLHDQQREAVTRPDTPLLVLAGAGSGKTRVLTRRIAWRCATGLDDPRRLLALTFTRAAATELQTRLRVLGLRDGVRAGTFHSIAWAEIRRLRAERNRPAPTLLDHPPRVLERLVPEGTPRRAIVDLAAELSWARARLVGPDGYERAASAAGRRPPLPYGQVAELAHRYAEEKRRRGLVDFDDLLEQLADAIEHEREVAEAQRWRSTHLYVDEYQDLNPLQDRLLRAWLGTTGALCAVGDPNQAIYGWNGADPTLIERFAEQHAGAAVLPVDRSYRSTPEILAVANALLDAGGCGGVRLHAVRPEGAVPVVSGYDDDATEARAVARACIDHRLPGRPWSHQAVLARTNAQLQAVEAALGAVGVPVRAGNRTPFAQRPTVRGVLRELSTAADLGAVLARFAAAVDVPDPDPDLVRLLDLADEYRAEERRPDGPGLRAFVVANAADDAGIADGVELRTFHAAKGLEWPVVHVVGVEDGFVPISEASTPAAVAEERRLLYVAFTRAEEVLRVSWAGSRAFSSGRTAARRPSPFLRELQPVLERLRAGATLGDWRTHLPAARPDRPAPSPVSARAEALQAWRRRRARAAGVRPAAVLADHVLADLAARDLTGPDDVAAVPGAAHLVAGGLADDLLAALDEEAAAR